MEFHTALIGNTLNPLNRVPPDKARHFIAGSLAGIVGSAIAIKLGNQHLLPWVAAAGLALVVGLAKEVLDARANLKATGNIFGVPRGTPHGVEGLDALATTLGGVAVGAPNLLSWLM